ncbi:MAG: endonuclease/exonuclease/phosphatase family protein [Treponema sp.]|nr:endonuclease/exonuclease/phosphatase family protein [Treponema sp.]
MKKNKNHMTLKGSGRHFLALACIVLIVSCGTDSCESSGSGNSSSKSIRVMNWNLQTFFDASFDGNEYTEYKSSKNGWSSEKYEARLERLCSVIKTLDADVVVIEEIEKEDQIQDVANRLSGTFDFSKLYRYAFFATGESSSIGCAVLSRYPAGEISVHSMDIRGNAEQPSMRPVIQFSLYLNDKTLVFFVNHWKSKSGGEEVSEIWRNRQEKILSNLMYEASKKNRYLIAAGDFNRNITEFTVRNSAKNVVLHGNQDFEVYSPWILDNGELKEIGSYWYQNEWERIDHFFAGGDTEITNFCVENLGEWADSDGHPFRYQIWNGKGYSDHFPITCTVKF